MKTVLSEVIIIWALNTNSDSKSDLDSKYESRSESYVLSIQSSFVWTPQIQIQIQNPNGLVKSDQNKRMMN